MIDPVAARRIEHVAQVHTSSEATTGSALVMSPSIDARRRIRQRALLLWPRLDRVRLARTAGDPERIARLVERRSALPVEVIVAMLKAGGMD